MKNANYNTKDVKNICEHKLDIEFRKSGKEYNGWFQYRGKKACRITVPKGRKRLTTGTYGAMARQLKLKIAEFDGLLECPLTKLKYEKILSEKIP